jgi:hypothetical protein
MWDRSGGASGFLVDELDRVVRKLEKRDGGLSGGKTGDG